MTDTPNQDLGSSVSLTRWQRWLRNWAYFRATIVDLCGSRLGLSPGRGQRRQSLRPRRLPVQPVYNTLEQRLAPTIETVTALSPAVRLDSTGNDAMRYTVRVLTEDGTVPDGGAVELRDHNRNDALVGSNTVRGGVAEFNVTHWSHGFNGFFAVYVGDEALDISASKSPIASASNPREFGQLPLRFEENEGQFDERVQFVSRGSGYDLFLMNAEATFVLPVSAPTPPDGLPEEGLPPAPWDDRLHEMAPRSSVIGFDVLRMQLVGANPDATAIGSSPLLTRSNYFIGSVRADWYVDIPNYAKVLYEDVYPGVNLVYYGSDTERQLEFDFVVAPGADPSTIRMQMVGAVSTRLDQYGNLLLTTPNQQSLTAHAPVVYQDKPEGRQTIFGRYTLEQDGAIGFRLGDYDETRPLIVDPVMAYGTFFGGAGGEGANNVAVDGAGYTYIAGSATSTTYPAPGATFLPTGSTSSNVFVAKGGIGPHGDSSAKNGS
jgi:hypothetical protein